MNTNSYTKQEYIKIKTEEFKSNNYHIKTKYEYH